MKRKISNLRRPYVFVPMSADYFHHGHINILIKANKLGNVIVGLMTDQGIKSYKGKKPLIKFKDRKKILENIKQVKKIISLNGLKYTTYAKKYKFNYFIHGDDWKSGVQSDQRKKLIKLMQKWKGKVVDVKYTKGISSTLLKNKFKKF